MEKIQNNNENTELENSKKENINENSAGDYKLYEEISPKGNNVEKRFSAGVPKVSNMAFSEFNFNNLNNFNTINKINNLNLNENSPMKKNIKHVDIFLYKQINIIHVK